MIIEHEGATELEFLSITKITILGIKEHVKSLIVNGYPHNDWEYSNGGLFIENLQLAVNDNFEIMFL